MYGLQYPQISPPRALDSDASHFLSFPCGSDLSANRSLTLNTGDADRALTLQGDPTLDDWFDQAVKTSDLPTFTGLNGSTALEFKVGGNLEATLYADELRFNNGANYTAIKWDGDGMVKLGVFNGAIYIDMLNIDSDEVSTPKTMKALSFESILESGISLAITSTTMNPNLNADMVDDKHVGTSGNTIGLLD